jgi:hypothetical protein
MSKPKTTKKTMKEITKIPKTTKRTINENTKIPKTMKETAKTKALRMAKASTRP